MKRRKLISVLLAATMLAAMFAGCGSDAASTDAKENADGADSTEAGGVKEFTAFFAVPGSAAVGSASPGRRTYLLDTAVQQYQGRREGLYTQR